MRGARWHALWIVVAFVLAWPIWDDRPRPGLDASWKLALSLVHVEGHHFGEDVVFTYGPLGFVVQPIVGMGWWYGLGVIVAAMLTAAIVLAVFDTLRMVGVPVAAAGPLTAVVVWLMYIENNVAEMVVLTGATWLLGRALRDRGLPTEAWWAIGAAGGLLVLVKVSVAPAVFVVLVACSGLAGRDRLIRAIGGFVLSLIVLWLVLAQPLAAYPRWIGGVFEVAFGHTAAMNRHPGGVAWEYVLIVALGVGGIVVALDAPVVRVIAARRERAVVVGAATLFLAWFLFRQGFTIHGPRSRVTFFSFGWILTVFVPWRAIGSARRAAATALVSIAVVASMVVLGAHATRRHLDPTRRPSNAWRAATQIVSSSERAEVVEGARRDAIEAYSIAPDILAEIGDAPVHVEPTELTAAWAHELDWRPLPTLQRYVGYTTGLDDRNAELLGAADRPEFVLRHTFGAIDDRLPTLESPRYVLELLCSYRLTVAGADWQLFERAGDRCGSMTETSTVELEPGEALDLPSVRSDEGLLIAVDFERSPLDRVAALVLKPISNPELIVDGTAYRMIRATSPEPGLLIPPAAAGWGPQLGVIEPPATVVGVDRRATVRLFVLDYDVEVE